MFDYFQEWALEFNETFDINNPIPPTYKLCDRMEELSNKTHIEFHRIGQMFKIAQPEVTEKFWLITIPVERERM